MDDEMIKARRADYAALTAERDRLAAENATLTATLERLREAIRRQHAELFYMTAAQHLRVGFDAKKETDNG